jgi:hypothetical protein
MNTAALVCGYRHGDRVRDIRDDTTGHVRILSPDPDETAGIDYARAEIVWDDHSCRFELTDHTAVWLEPLD